MAACTPFRFPITCVSKSASIAEQLGESGKIGAATFKESLHRFLRFAGAELFGE